MTLTEAQDRLKDLPTKDRAELLDWLWEGLQSQDVLRRQALWAAESERRIEAVNRGELSTIDGPTALEQLRRSLDS